jgi:hypothetical protein
MKYLIGLVIFVIALLTATYYRRQGYNFWRTLVLMIIMQIGIILLVAGLFT